MASTLECVDRETGSLDSKDVIESEISKIIAELHIYSEMLGDDRENERGIVRDIRNHLCEIRDFTRLYLRFTPKTGV